MSSSVSWENIPSEIWFTILESLPIKSQVSLGCTCKRMYQLSLDSFLPNLDQRTWVYLRDKTPLPDLLAKAISILYIPPPQSTDKDLGQRSLFLQGEIQRMSNLQKLVIEKDAEENECMLSFLDLHEIVLQQNLAELKVPGAFFIQKFSAGKTLLHLAVEKGNVKLVNSLLSHMKVCFQNDEIKRDTTLPVVINASDEQGNTPLKIAVENGNDELILFLLKNGARSKEYLLSKDNTDLSSLLKGAIDQGSHLQIDYLSPSDYPVFFEAIAESSSFLSLSFSAECYREIKKTGLDFFQGLAGALQSNFQRCATPSQEDLENTAKSLRLLILDLRDCEELTIQEAKPFFTCLGLEELWLPTSLLDHLNEQKQNLLHLLVQESPMNKKVAESLIAQGVALSNRDHKGRTPVELARELDYVTGSHEMAIFLEQAAKKKLTAIAFGKKDWEKYFGKVGKEPPLSIDMLEVLESSCPIWPNRKVADTHLLTLIPENVNSKPFTLNYLQELVKNPKGGGNKTQCEFCSESVKVGFERRPLGSTYWILMTKSVLPNTQSKCFEDQLLELNALAAKAPKITGLGEYKTPKALEVATSILMEYVRSGVRLYPSPENGLVIYTYCEETLVPGGWRVIIGGEKAVSGLDVYFYFGENDDYGLGALRKCYDL